MTASVFPVSLFYPSVIIGGCRTGGTMTRNSDGSFQAVWDLAGVLCLLPSSSFFLSVPDLQTFQFAFLQDRRLKRQARLRSSS